MSPPNTVDLVLRPRDPVILRDARPFSADPGARAVTLDWPLPQTVAGAVRAFLVTGARGTADWPPDAIAEARRIAVAGPLLLGRRAADVAWTVYFPAPADAVPLKIDATTGAVLDLLCLRPTPPPDGAGCNLPRGGLAPMGVDKDDKPAGSIQFWSQTDVEQWLRLVDKNAWSTLPDDIRPPVDALDPLSQETRVHVRMDAGTQAHDEGGLFSTTALAFGDSPGLGRDRYNRPTVEHAILCRVQDHPEIAALGDGRTPRTVTLGGERRVAEVLPAGAIRAAWSVPTDVFVARIAEAIAKRRHLRLQLATPALFATHGWRPAWLSERDGILVGTLLGVRVRLRGVAMGRRIPVSGWDLESKQPKATRYAVPAGSVYFFDVLDGTLDPDQIRQLWLHPIPDRDEEETARNGQPAVPDGYGLALPGLW